MRTEERRQPLPGSSVVFEGAPGGTAYKLFDETAESAIPAIAHIGTIIAHIGTLARVIGTIVFIESFLEDIPLLRRKESRRTTSTQLSDFRGCCCCRWSVDRTKCLLISQF